jgi:peptidoglycan/LPS O-acetylase OafA/YrhL
MIAHDTNVAAEERPDARGHRLGYQPALDGIRALAVSAVLAYHAGFGWARGGFLGVDAFFVLSGFLITSLLLAEWRERRQINLLAFYARRARRLLPALFLMLLGVAAYAVFFAGRLELERIREDAFATIGYVANWRPIFAGQSYFDQFSLPSPLRHTWSLGIEEQYYIFWPLMALLLLRLGRGTTKVLLPVSIVLIVASATLMGVLFQPGHDPSRVYYGTDTRAQSLLIGATLAVLLLHAGPIRNLLAGRLLQVAAIVCAVGLGFCWSRTSEDSTLLFRGGFLLLALSVAVVITAAVQPKTGPLGRLLALPPLRGLGLISYGVYLWHWPLYMVLTPDRVGLDSYSLFGVRVATTLAVSIVSYHLIEMPVRRGAFRGWKVAWTFAPAGAACVAVAVVLTTRGALIPVTVAPVTAMPQVEASAISHVSRVMVIGDSVALSLEPGLTQISQGKNLAVWNRARLYCGFVPSDFMVDLHGSLSADQEQGCKDWRRTWQGDVEAYQPDLVLMLFGSWDYPDHVVNGVKLETGTPEWSDYVLGQLQTQLNSLTAQGAKLGLVTWPYPGSILWKKAGEKGEEAEEDAHWRVDDLNGLYRRFAEEHPDKVVVFDLNSFASPEGKFTDLYIDGIRMREDGIHFTSESSYIVGKWLVQQIFDMGGSGATMPGADGMASVPPTRALILGDSVGLSMRPGFDDQASTLGVAAWNRSMVGCGFLDVDSEYGYDGKLSSGIADSCRNWRETWASDIAAFHPDVVALVFGAMDSLDRVLDGKTLKTGTPEWETFVTDGLDKQVDALSSQGARIALLTFPCSKPAAWAFFPDVDKYEAETSRRIDDLNEVYRRYAAEHPGKVTLIDLYAYTCPEGEFSDLEIDGVRMREDGLHFTPEGSAVLARWLGPQLVDIAHPAQRPSSSVSIQGATK